MIAVLYERQDLRNLFAIGVTAHFSKRQDVAIAAYTQLALSGRTTATPFSLVQTARALANLGVALRAEQRPFAEVEQAYRDAAQAGRDAGSTKGLVATATALAASLVNRKAAGRPTSELQALCKEATAAASQAGLEELKQALDAECSAEGEPT